VTRAGFVWTARGTAVPPGPPLVSAGNQPLLTEELVEGRRVFHADLDPIGSTLQLSPDWPILLGNLAEARRRELPGPERTSLALGESFRFHAHASARYRFEGPGFEREFEGRTTIEIDGAVRPGVYTLSDERGALCEVAYSFVDAAESDLSAMLPGRREGTRSIARVLAGFSWTEMALLAAIVALLVLDWWVLARARRRLPQTLAGLTPIIPRGARA
jgi:hypothetical protein